MSEFIDPIQITRADITRGFGFSLVCSGYLVENGKVLLVHHRGFNKWVPPGGHIEAGDTFAETVKREVLEETGLDVEVLSTAPVIINDANASPLPVPFYVDLEREGFRFPSITQFFYVRRTDRSASPTPQLAEIHDLGWFDSDEIDSIPTFDQVRAVAKYALLHHPDAQRTR